ncbi:YdiK family protein [Bacillus testis]|uniref:YdiK family protein n=1 Tax=Bacillus testis TaxID=1622072 RepID=UPI00067E7B1F|nr:YdiK family protein [Bacillus testis]
MRRQSPLVSSFMYILLGVVFTFFAINYVSDNGWTFFAYLIVFLATIDFGTGIRLLMLYFRLRRMKKK